MSTDKPVSSPTDQPILLSHGGGAGRISMILTSDGMSFAVGSEGHLLYQILLELRAIRNVLEQPK